MNLSDFIENYIGLNDAASRNKVKIGFGMRPRLNAELLAQKGHSITGVDFSENSIQYAIKQAKEIGAVKYRNPTDINQ